VVEHRGASSEESKPLTVRRDEKRWVETIPVIVAVVKNSKNVAGNEVVVCF